MVKTYHILRRKSDGSIKSFGLGEGNDWNDPAAEVEVVEGDFGKEELALKAQLVPDPISPEDELKQTERATALQRLVQKAEQDSDLDDLLKVLDLR